jgi:hypothetical protein
MSTPIQNAITLLQIARDELERELWHRGAHYATNATSDNQDLAEVAADLGPLLHTLESLV